MAPEPNAVIESLAQAQHFIWLNEMRRKGWKFGIETNETDKVHAWLVIWDGIPEKARAEYRMRVRMIPKIVRAAGLALVEDIGAQAEGKTIIATTEKRGRDGSNI